MVNVGIGLPAAIPGVDGTTIGTWAREADDGPFTSLGVIDRVAYPNLEPLISLAAAAGATQRIRLVSTIVVGPLRQTVFLAKQAAALSVISEGRFTLGLGVGGREEDFRALSVPFQRRGELFEDQLATLSAIWRGEKLADDVGPIGPAMPVGSPPVLIAANSAPAARRTARWGVGYISGSRADPARATELYDVVLESWRAAGKAGAPEFVAGSYFALGRRADEEMEAYIRHYYGQHQAISEDLVARIPTSRAAIMDTIAAYAERGADEVILWPCIGSIDQLRLLADVVG